MLNIRMLVIAYIVIGVIYMFTLGGGIAINPENPWTIIAIPWKILVWPVDLIGIYGLELT